MDGVNIEQLNELPMIGLTARLINVLHDVQHENTDLTAGVDLALTEDDPGEEAAFLAGLLQRPIQGSDWVITDAGDLVHLSRLEMIELRTGDAHHIIYGSAGNHHNIAMFRRHTREECVEIMAALADMLSAVEITIGEPVEGPRGSFGGRPHKPTPAKTGGNDGC